MSPGAFLLLSALPTDDRTGDEETPVGTLPSEILCKVMDAAASSGPASVAAAAQVCRRWRDPAQRALFLDVTLDLQLNSVRSVAWLTSAARLRFPTRAMSLSFTRDEEAEAARCLEGSQALRKLVLQEHFVADEESAPGGLHWRVFNNLPALTELHLHCPEQLTHPYSPAPGALRLPFRLTHLFLWLAYNRLASTNFLATLFSSSTCSSLRHLTLWLGGDASMDDLADAFPSVARRLQIISLRYHGPAPLFLPLLKHCTTLETLEIAFPPNGFGGVGGTLDRLLEVVQGLPESPTTVSELVIKTPPDEIDYLVHDISFEPLQKALGCRQLKALRRIVFPDLRERDELAYFGEENIWVLSEACEERDIMIVYRDFL